MNYKILLLFLFVFFHFLVKAQYQHPEGKFIEVNGARLWVEIAGRGEPLFLIAGGPGSSHVYLHNYDALKDSNLLVFVDYYGRGKSDTVSDLKKYSIERDVNDVDGVRKILGFNTINVLGHSYGGVVAQLYAAKYGDHVKHLIISNSGYSAKMFQEAADHVNYKISRSRPELWDTLMMLREKGYRSSDPQHYNLYLNSHGSLIMFYNPENAAKLTFDASYINDFNYKLCYQISGSDGDFTVGNDYVNFDVTTHLKQLKMPTLIIAGRYDNLFPPNLSIKYKQYCPQARFVMFEKSGHFPQVEEPERVFTLINEFLGR